MLTDATKQSIQALYRDFLTAKGLKPRLGQKQMIAEVARILNRMGDASDPPIGLIEAETGTGKTLAYLIGALPVALEFEKPLVIATATVALQSQIVEKDLPALLDATDLMLTWALAKGRRRYLCPLRLETALDTVTSADALYPDELTLVLDADDRAFVENLSRAWVDGTWTGDMDQIPETLPDTVRQAVTTDHSRCQGRQCRSFAVCPYFNARETWLEADVLVINHDLLLSDLKLGGGVILPPLADSVLVIDEAHQLASTAADQFTSQIRIAQCLGAIKTLERVCAAIQAHIPSDDRLHRDLQALPTEFDRLGHLLANWGRDTLTMLSAADSMQFGFQNGGSRYRLAIGESVPPADAGGVHIEPLFATVRKIQDWLKSLTADSDGVLAESDADTLYSQIGLAMGRLEALPQVISAISDASSDQSYARWIRVGQDVRDATPDDPTDLEYWVSPMTPADGLAETLWGQIGGCILTSATLANRGQFDVVARALGITQYSGLCVEGAFHYASQGRLVIPDEAGDPRDETVHANRIATYLNRRCDSDSGILVLFTSWRLLFQVEELLTANTRDTVLVQGSQPLSVLLETHAKQRGHGETSILFGLQSMAEGLDLPGDLANEVVITRLPFQPPDDPREATFAEYLKLHGQDPFSELSLPKATIRLRQAVGRLIRSEQDSGQITVLDRRLVNTRWGRSLIQELPAFQMEG
jgi:ATP-dependent DNA helicase DinG